MPSHVEPTETLSPSCEPIPLIIVEGFLGSAGAALWGDFQHFLNQDCSETPRRVIFAKCDSSPLKYCLVLHSYSVGPVSSLHDRACELYYALLGGTVDYGEDHSKIHQHSQYGRTNREGLYPRWSRQHPLHFLGHSMGGPTIMKLQFLLKQGFFGPHVHPDMILSVNTISSPFRGTQLVYTLGERADAAPAVRPLSVGSLLAKWVHLVTFLSPLLPRTLDLHAESRSLTYRELSFVSLLRQLWSSDWAESRDATPFDVTFEAADERESNAEGHIHSSTFYRSYVACLTSSLLTDFKTAPLLSLCTAPLYLTSRTIAAFDFTTLQPIPSFLDQAVASSDPHTTTSPKTQDTEQGLTSKLIGREYWTNDGVVPLFSQWHPFPCSVTRCKHVESDSVSGGRMDDKPEVGVWHVEQINGEANHLSLVPFWIKSPRQKAFWENLGRWLRTIDATRQSSCDNSL